MVEDHDQHMLLALEERLENGPYHIGADEIADIGARAQPPLSEHQSYRVVNRLHREGRIIGAPITAKQQPAGWVQFSIKDILL